MPHPEIKHERCKGCGLCVENCPKHVIQMSKKLNKQGYFTAEVVDQEHCTGCRLCAIACPDVGIDVYGKKKGDPK